MTDFNGVLRGHKKHNFYLLLLILSVYKRQVMVFLGLRLRSQTHCFITNFKLSQTKIKPKTKHVKFCVCHLQLLIMNTVKRR